MHVPEPEAKPTDPELNQSLKNGHKTSTAIKLFFLNRLARAAPAQEAFESPDSKVN